MFGPEVTHFRVCLPVMHVPQEDRLTSLFIYSRYLYTTNNFCSTLHMQCIAHLH